MPITIGSLDNVPAPGDPIRSPWAQEVSGNVVHQFTSTANRDAVWTAPPNGSICETLDTYRVWQRRAGVWVQIAGRTPGCDLSPSVAQNIPNATYTAVAFDTEFDDPDGLHTPGAPTRITVPAGFGGRWLFTYNVGFATSTVGTRNAFLRVNAAATDRRGFSSMAGAATLADANLGGANISRLVAGDYVELVVYHTAGATLALLGDATAGHYTTLGATWLSE